MARTRSIKPSFFDNELLGGLSPLTRLLFIGLWGQADRAGRLEDRPLRLKKNILGYDDVTVADVDNMLESLNANFYTFGSDPGFPYQNGWVEVRAASREEADRKFRARFPDRPGHEGIMNYAFCYNEQRWAEMDPEHTWTGRKLHEIIE